jgi:hypothetical protein
MNSTSMAGVHAWFVRHTGLNLCFVASSLRTWNARSFELRDKKLGDLEQLGPFCELLTHLAHDIGRSQSHVTHVLEPPRNSYLSLRIDSDRYSDIHAARVRFDGAPGDVPR